MIKPEDFMWGEEKMGAFDFPAYYDVIKLIYNSEDRYRNMLSDFYFIRK